MTIPPFEHWIEALLALERHGIVPTDITVPPEQFEALHNDLGSLSSAKWGLPHIQIHGPHGLVRVWEAAPRIAVPEDIKSDKGAA